MKNAAGASLAAFFFERAVGDLPTVYFQPICTTSSLTSSVEKADPAVAEST
jgi:hypothetical protein